MALAADVPGEPALVVERLERDVKAESHPRLLRHNVDEVRLRLEGDVELEEVPRDRRVERERLGAELLEQSRRAGRQQVRVILDREAGLGSLAPGTRRRFSASAGRAPDPQGVVGETLCARLDLGGFQVRVGRGPCSGEAGCP